MKRIGHLHEKICTLQNVYAADLKARKNKKKHCGIKKHDKNQLQENEQLVRNMKDLTYHTSKYTTFKVYEPKERIIFRLPYYPDRITHHAIMNVLEPIFVDTFIDQTYACIKHRGIRKLSKDIQKALKDHPNETKYCLKLDIKKFYPSVDHAILYELLKHKIKDKQLLLLLHEIINSADGVPIGNYLSQYFANFYLSYFDHWMKEEVKCKFYFRYADDVTIFSDNKEWLHNVLIAIKFYLKYVLKLTVKNNYQIFPIDGRGLDFVGYKFFHSHVLLRKSIKRRMWRLIHNYKTHKISLAHLTRSLQSYFGWLKYCNSKHLLQKIHKITGIKYSNWVGEDDCISNYYNKRIYVISVQRYTHYYMINFLYKGKAISVKSTSNRLYQRLIKLKLPTNFKIVRYDNSKKD